MDNWYQKTELFVDKAIPYLIIVLFGVVITDVFFHDLSVKYQNLLFFLDVVIISFFVADLIFKYIRVHNIPRFLRLYWLDILAVFPFFLFLRIFEEILLLSESTTSALRNLFHTGLILQEEALAGEEAAAKIVKTSEMLAKEGRVAVLSERIAFLRRVPRLFKAISFYEHPKQKQTLYHKKR